MKCQSLSLKDPYDESGTIPQTAQIQLDCTYNLVGDVEGTDGKNGILINLGALTTGEEATTATSAISGQMMLNTHWSQYYYTWQVDVMVMVDAQSRGKVNILQEGPPTTPESKVITSSTSFNAGFNGDEPTGGVTLGSSTSQTLPDFAVQNTSQHLNGILNHRYYLASLGDNPCGFGNPKSAPEQAYSNIPIISQGLWVTDTTFTEKTTFEILIQMQLIAAHANFVENVAKYSPLSLNTYFEVDWGQYAKLTSS